jgi:hypothetical protein
MLNLRKVLGSHVLLDRFLLSLGAAFYGGVLTLFAVQFFDYGLTTTILLPLLVLTVLGIAATVVGLVARGPISFYNADALLSTGSILGVLGFFGWLFGGFVYQHTVNVCEYSKVVPYDASAQWACPQAVASNYVMWTLAVGLLVPSLLYLGGLNLAIRQRQRHRSREHRPVGVPGTRLSERTGTG